MPNYTAGASNKDGTTGYLANTTGPYLTAYYEGTLGNNSAGYALLDTSPIGTDTITAAVLYWYHGSYTIAGKGTTYNRNVNINYTLVFSASTSGSVGWNSQVLTAGQYALINKTGETHVGFFVTNPGSGKARTWTIRSWDYSSSTANTVYLAVTHVSAGGVTKRSIILI